MNFNVGVDYPSFIAWDGAQSFPVKIDGFNQFGFTFKTTEELDAPVTFNVFYHAPSAGDPCVPGPAVRAGDVATCAGVLSADGFAAVTLPEGTSPDSFCAGTLPCIDGQWVSIAPAVAATGDNVQITVTLKGRTR